MRQQVPEEGRVEPAAPDFSGLDFDDLAVYEWLLSDHPWAAVERSRQRAGRLAHRRAEMAWLAAVARVAADDGLAGRVAAEVATQIEVDSAEPDDAGVLMARRELEAARRSTEPGYAYPRRYLGPAAALFPPPPRLGGG